jgi:exonuclease III
LSPVELRKAGGGLRISARQALLAKHFFEAGFDVIGLHECRLPATQFSQAGQYTCVYSASVAGCDGCGLWVRTALAKCRHIVVLHQDPSKLVVVIRAPCFSLNALVLHAPVEGGDTNEAWWAETLRIQALLLQHTHNLNFVDANGRLGFSCSAAVGSVFGKKWVAITGARLPKI